MLFCLRAQYTPEALRAMRENPNTNRQEAAQQLAEAAGGKVLSFHHTISGGPGALVIVDIPDPDKAIAMCSIATSSGSLQNVHFERLFTVEQVATIRQKGRDLRSAYKAPGEA